MRVAVTGGAGFIGSHVVDKLVQAGALVTVIDPATTWLHREVEHQSIDMLDVPAVTRAVAGCDAVFHLAGVSDVDHAFREPVDAVRANIEGTACVLDAARATSARVILASSVWVYGAAAQVADPATELDEDVPFDLTRSSHVYTASKLAAESLMHSYQALYGVPITILRYGVPYGPRMRAELVIARFVRMALAREPLTIAGDGRQSRNYVYVEDLAQAHVAALAPQAVGQTFALEGARAVSIREIAETVHRVLDVDLRIKTAPVRPGDYDNRRAISAAKAARVLGWTPATSFAEGVRRYVDWYLGQQPDEPVAATGG